MINKVKDWKSTQLLPAQEKFWELWNSCDYVEESPESTFFKYVNNELFFMLSHKIKYLNCSYEFVWKIFKEEYEMTDLDIVFMIKKTLNLEGYIIVHLI